MKLRLSVITICFNNPDELIKSCNSVSAQSSLPDEHVIIDGSSNKEILNWLQSNPQPSYRRWIYERDKGISDAFNKGIKLSAGNILQFLNSGDIYFDDDVLKKITALFSADESIQWSHGKMQLIRGNSKVIIGKPFDKNKLYRGMRSTFHPTMFVKRELFERYGGFFFLIPLSLGYKFFF